MAKTPWIVPIMPRASEGFGSFGTSLPTCLDDFFASLWRTTAAGFAKTIKENITQS